MKATVIFEVEVMVEIPDDLPEKVRQLAKELGENYVSVDATDEKIVRRIALIRGVRRLDHDESMTEELNRQINVEIVDDTWCLDFEWRNDD